MKNYILEARDFENPDKEYLVGLIQRLEANIVDDEEGWMLIVESEKDIESFPEFYRGDFPWAIKNVVEYQI